MNHPGTVVYVDGDTGQVQSSWPVGDVPLELRFVETPHGPVPVVRVVATARGDARIVREYGPSGELLRSTVMTSR